MFLFHLSCGKGLEELTYDMICITELGSIISARNYHYSHNSVIIYLNELHYSVANRMI